MMWFKSFFGKGFLAVLILASAIVLQGCLGEDDVYNSQEFLERDKELIESYISSNNINASLDSINEIYYVRHDSGDGYRTVRGTEIDLHYAGYTLEGVEFVNTFSGTPERINIGTKLANSGLTPTDYTWGLDEWLLFNGREGDSITVFLPSPFGFEDVSYRNVPANTPIMYTVKFVDILQLSEDLTKIDNYIADKSWSVEIEPTYGTRVVKHEVGDPETRIDFNDFININYEGKFLDDEVFDSNFGDNPLSFTLGGGQSSFIVGFELGLLSLNQNDSATFFIPSIYGYGKDGRAPDIPGNTPLAFTIKVGTVVKND